MNRLHRIYLDPTGAEGGDPTPDDKDKDKGKPAPRGTDDVSVYRELLREREQENFRYREQIRTLKKNAVPEGHVVIEQAVLDEIEAYRALGKAAALKVALAEKDQFKAELDEARRADLRKQAAEASGFKEPVLSRLIKQDGTEIEVRDEKVGGKAAPVAYVKGVDDKGVATLTKLTDHAEKVWAEFLPSLKITAAPVLGTPPGDETGRHHPQPRNGAIDKISLVHF